MNKIDFRNIKHVHFIGIGGISMSALAHLTKSFGIKVTGSDLHKNDETAALTKLGIKVFVGHSAKNIAPTVDLVVATGAIREDNCELIKCKQLNLTIFERSKYLGIIASRYKSVISIAGTHGKTTTTAMIASIFVDAEFSPTVHIGGESVLFGNLLIGEKNYFITEACEYRNSFKYLNSQTALVTNIEKDHLDYFKSYKQIELAFLEFAENSTQNIVIYNNKKFSKKIKSDAQIFSCGFNSSFDFYAHDIKQKKFGFSFKVTFKNKYLGECEIKMLGRHNVCNALAAISVAYLYDIPLATIKKSLLNFAGVKRRYEIIGGKDFPVIADYAHHPTEIKNSLMGIKNNFEKILCIFQPHLFSRTKLLMDDFQSCFDDADLLAVFKTYPAREDYDAEGDEHALFNKLNHSNKLLIMSKNKLKALIKNANKNGFTTLVLGAGDIYDIVNKLIKKCGKLY